MREPQRKLALFIAAKAVLELLFVVFLAANFHQRAFDRQFEGRIEEANQRRVAGWVIGDAAPPQPTEVQLYINDQFTASRVAERPRRGAADDARGFEFDVPPLAAGEYEARVYVVRESGGGARRTLQALTEPVRIRVGAEQR